MFVIIGKFEEEAKNNSSLTGCSHKNDTTKNRFNQSKGKGHSKLAQH